MRTDFNRREISRSFRTVFTCLLIITGLMLSVSLHADEGQAEYRWDAVSEREKYQAELGPVEGPVRIGRFQQWELRLLDHSGKPVFPARINMDGGMPGHGHGLPTRPQVTKYLGDGRWLIEGMKLNMTGEWLLVFGIQTPKSVDRVEFTFIVEY